MFSVKIVFWLGLFIVFYSYIGYGLLLWVYLRLKGLFVAPKKTNFTGFEPPVTLIVATFNEEAIIEEKILNCLALDYPADKLTLLFAADGSNDKTVDIISKYPRINLYFKPERAGKVAAINRVMPEIKTPYVIFSDANTFLNKESIREILKHYADEKVGAVAGEKKVMEKILEGGAVAGEGIYWKYESFLKKLDSEFYTVVGAAGELFSIKSDLFEPTPGNVLLDDFIISLKICKKGYRVVYEPLAYATETPSDSMLEEQKRKIRISAGGFQSMLMLKDLLNISRYGKLSFQYISHRVLRWAICPFLLPLILAANLLLVMAGSGWVYVLFLACQAIFYAAALLGWLFSLNNIKVKLFYIPYYFVFMNVALYIGLKRFLTNKQSVLWDKAKRKT
ncbi:MAG: glycosyltransferase family 2 protein [Ferruginibacter sp.]